MRRKVQRLVRTYIIGCLATHSQDPILSFPAAESGRISGQAASSYILCERQRSPSRHLWRVGVQRLVGFYYSSAVLGFAFPYRIRAVRDLRLSVVEGP